MPTIVPQPRQLSIFDPQFNNVIRRVIINDKVHFSILDTFQFKGDAKNPTTSWRTARSRLEKAGFDSAREILEHQFPGKGQKPTPVCTFKTMMRIAQVTDFPEWEPLRDWMAGLADERVEETKEIGLASQNARKRELAQLHGMGYTQTEALQKLEVRIEGIDTYKQLMAIIKTICDKPRYGDIVNAEYVALFGEVASGLQDILGTKNVRDALPYLQLTYIKTAEVSMTAALSNRDNVTMAQIIQLVDRVIVPLGEMLRTVCEIKGVHHITGQKLLP